MAEGWLRFIYESELGRMSLLKLMRRKIVSVAYGAYCKTKFSARHIGTQVKQYNIDLTGCQEKFSNYAEFFSRQRQNITFPESADVIGSPCQCAASAYSDISSRSSVMAKGNEYPLSELVGDAELAKKYHGGLMLKFRLAPSDYHRVHFFDSGTVLSAKFLDGHLYSVNPIAVDKIAKLYCANKRAVFLQHTDNFGDVLFVEVGATMVGSIKHCFNIGDSVSKGSSAAYFLPGGSLVLVFFENGRFKPCELLQRTELGFETKLDVGQAVL